MSDSESTLPAAPHATTGGKSLASLERPRYKSWRKKYRKMRIHFDGVFEENRRLYKDEQKLENIARRLREELDGLLELCLEFNDNPALDPDLRFDVSTNRPHTVLASLSTDIPDDITPRAADQTLAQYHTLIQSGTLPALDGQVVRAQIERKLARQGVLSLQSLQDSVPHTVYDGDSSRLPQEMNCESPPGYIPGEQEDLYLTRLDGKLGDPLSLAKSHELHRESNNSLEDRPWHSLTPREMERQAEIFNPQSQHNWIKQHAKHGAPIAADIDDNESLASHDPKATRGGGGGGKRNLAKQVGDRAVERAREGFSPSAASAGFAEDDDSTFADEHIGTPSSSSKKRSRLDADGPYRVKGSKSTGGAGVGKGKRKRSGEDMPGGGYTNSASKKAKTEVE